MATFRKRDGKWQAIIRKRGYPTSTKTFTLKSHAEAWAARQEFALEATQAGVASGKMMTVRDVLEKFRDEVSPKRKGERWEEYRIDAFLENDWVSKRCDRLSAENTLRDWRDKRLEQVKPGTVIRELSLLSGIFGHAIKEAWVRLPANPCSLIRWPTAPKPRTSTYTQEQFELVAGSVPEHGPQSARDWMRYCAWFARETGMREGEVCQVRWSDIDVAAKTVLAADEWTPENKAAPSIKNSYSRIIPLSLNACALLNRLSSFAPDADMSDRIFGITKGSLCQYWMDAKNKAGLPGLNFHDIRRTSLTRMAKNFDVMTLAKISGHRDVNELMNTYYQPNMSEMADKMG